MTSSPETLNFIVLWTNRGRVLHLYKYLMALPIDVILILILISPTFHKCVQMNFRPSWIPLSFRGSRTVNSLSTRNILGILPFQIPAWEYAHRRQNTSRAVSSRTTMSSSDTLAQASRHLLAGAVQTKRFEWIVVCGGFLAFFAAFGIGTHTMRALFTFRVHQALMTRRGRTRAIGVY